MEFRGEQEEPGVDLAGVVSQNAPSGGVDVGTKRSSHLRGVVGQGAPSYKNAFCYSDLLVAYQNVLEQKQHQACTKQEGQTNHIERFNLTLRQRLGRLVRKTLSFSKSLFMHILSIRLFLHSYNQGQAQNYNASRAT